MLRPHVLLLTAVSGLASAQSVVVGHTDLNQTGSNTAESILSPATVQSSRFRNLGSYAVDGMVFAQPLYVPGVMISGTRYNLLIVATLPNSVYAFDADVPGLELWRVNFGSGYQGIDTVAFYGQLVGIVGTPAADSGYIYVIQESSTPAFTLLKLDITTGATVASTVITGHFPGTGDPGGGDPVSGGNLFFNPSHEWQRTALTIANGNVYIGFGGAGDERPWHGWLFAYSVSDLSQVGVFCTTPSAYGGAVWQSGRGPVIDADGNVYVVTGNDDDNPDSAEYGESVVKLSPTLSLMDWFTPSNFASLDAADADFSSNGPILIPGTQYLEVAGKDFNVYILDSACLGHLEGSNPACSLQTFKTNPSGAPSDSSGSYGSAFLNGMLYLPTTAGSIYAFSCPAGACNATPAATQTNSYGFPGPAAMSASSDGASNGLIWVTTAASSSLTQKVPGILHALDAMTLAEYWNSSGSGDSLGSIAKYNPPTIASGKVFVANQDGLVQVYGLVPSSALSGQAILSGSATIH